MAKLYFRYGSVGSAKTLNLLAVAHNYRSQGKQVLLLKPAHDVRFGKRSIRSRAGLEMDADLLVDESTDLLELNFKGISCLLVDEAQFLVPTLIDQLRSIATYRKIPVICYGLRTDFRTLLFSGAKRLMELADSIEEVKSTCHYCQKKSVMNVRHIDGKASLDGEQVQLGAEESYLPVCAFCYYKQQYLAGNLKEPTLILSN